MDRQKLRHFKLDDKGATTAIQFLFALRCNERRAESMKVNEYVGGRTLGLFGVHNAADAFRVQLLL